MTITGITPTLHIYHYYNVDCPICGKKGTKKVSKLKGKQAVKVKAVKT